MNDAYLVGACGNGAQARWNGIFWAGADHTVVLQGYSSEIRGAMNLYHSTRMVNSSTSTTDTLYGLLEWFA